MNDRRPPQILIIIRTYNEERQIARAIASYLREGFSPNEIMLADGASTDDTVRIAESLGVTAYIDPIRDGVERTNRAVAKFGRDFMVILDADMEAVQGFGSELRERVAAGAECIVIPERSIPADTPLSRGRAFERSLFAGDMTIEAARGFSKRVWDECGGFVAPTGVDDWYMSVQAAKKAPLVRMNYGVLHYELALTPLGTVTKYMKFGHGYVWLLRRDRKAFFAHGNPIRPSVRRGIGVLLTHPKETLNFISFKSLVYLGGMIGFTGAILAETFRALKRNSPGKENAKR